MTTLRITDTNGKLLEEEALSEDRLAQELTFALANSDRSYIYWRTPNYNNYNVISAYYTPGIIHLVGEKL